MHDSAQMRPRQPSSGSFALLLALSCMVQPAQAQDYPDRAVKIIVPFPAGGTADAIPRIVADWLSRKWGQPVVIENRTGAAGNIGAEQVYHSPPDGYTLLSAPPPPLVINQNLYPKLGFDPTKFEPIIVMAQVPNALIVNPNKVKASSVPELIAYLQQQSRQGHLRHARQRHDVASDVRDVSTDGEGEAAAHSLSRLGAGAAGAACRRRRLHVRQSRRLLAAGRGRQAEAARGRLIRAAAVACRTCRRSPKRCRDSKPSPGMAIVAPPKTPKAIIDKINADVNEALRQPELQDQLKKLSAGDFRRLGREDVRIHARGSRPMGRGDQVGQHRAAVSRGLI